MPCDSHGMSHKLARPEGFEPPTPRFVVWCPIQLSSRRAAIASTRGRNSSFWILYIGRLYGCAALAGTASSLVASRCSVVALRHRERWLSQVARTACRLSGPRLTCALPGRRLPAPAPAQCFWHGLGTFSERRCFDRPRSNTPELSKNVIQKGLAFDRDWSGSVLTWVPRVP